MAIPQETLVSIKNLLLSNRMSYQGNEIAALNKILADIDVEANRQALETRVKPKLVPDLPEISSDSAEAK